MTKSHAQEDNALAMIGEADCSVMPHVVFDASVERAKGSDIVGVYLVAAASEGGRRDDVACVKNGDVAQASVCVDSTPRRAAS